MEFINWDNSKFTIQECNCSNKNYRKTGDCSPRGVFKKFDPETNTIIRVKIFRCVYCEGLSSISK